MKDQRYLSEITYIQDVIRRNKVRIKYCSNFFWRPQSPLNQSVNSSFSARSSISSLPPTWLSLVSLSLSFSLCVPAAGLKSVSLISIIFSWKRLKALHCDNCHPVHLRGPDGLPLFLLLLFLGLIVTVSSQNPFDQVNWEGEYECVILLRRNGAQRLK